MKKFDYIVIQAPMISDLGLKGNSLLLFALIHSYTRDQKHTFRASLKDMAEWFTTSENAINSTLKALVKSGYINKLGSNNAPEYTTNFESLMAKVEAEGALRMDRVYKEKDSTLLNQECAQNAVKANTTESVALLNQYGKGTESVVSNTTESVVSTYYKYNINIYKYSSSYSELTEAQKQQEEKYFYQLFFFRGAVNPSVEVKRFIAHNQANGWQNKSGSKYDSTEKRMGLAEFWEFKTGARDCKTFLEVWEKVFSRLAENPNAEILLDQRIKFSYENDKMLIHCTADQARFIDFNFDKIKDVLMAHAAGRAMCYKIIH